MQNYILLLLLLVPNYAFSVNQAEETTILLKNRDAKDVIPYLTPHLQEDGRITGLDKNITIKSNRTNINELLAIIGDLDRIDYKQLIISITMNINRIHNLNTRNIKVGANTWTKINYGRTYSERIRETLPNGNLVEKIKNIRVIESIRIYTEIDNTNKNIILKLKISNNDSLETEELAISEVNIDELAENDLTIKLKGKVNKWIDLSDAINSLYLSNDEDDKVTRERQKLTNKIGIKVQLLQ